MSSAYEHCTHTNNHTCAQAGKVPKANVDACRSTIGEEWFTFEIMSNKSKAAGGITSFIKNIVIHYDTT